MDTQDVQDIQDIQDIRDRFLKKYKSSDFVIDKSNVRMIELLGVSFIVNEDYIFRSGIHDSNKPHINHELRWYSGDSNESRDSKDSRESDEIINSNYEWCVFSKDNGNQYLHVLEELQENPNSRRATMIYNRPTMHIEYKTTNDFICTYANGFFIRDNKLISQFIMRSNNAVYGFSNDVLWAKYVHEKLANDLGIEIGDLIWTVSSMHVYEQDFHLLESLNL